METTDQIFMKILQDMDLGQGSPIAILELSVEHRPVPSTSNRALNQTITGYVGGKCSPQGCRRPCLA